MTGQAHQQMAQEALSAELKAIQTLDPTIKSLEDLRNMEESEAFTALLQRGGISMTEAYKIAAFDRLNAQKAQTAAAATRKNIAGKSHLNATGERGGGLTTVPTEVMEVYKALMPDLSAKELAEHYERSVKN